MRLSEEELRKLTIMAISELGDNATPQRIKEVVAKAAENAGRDIPVPSSDSQSSGRVILTSYGLNKSGVVSKITSKLSESNCDIQDITQKILDDFFTMIMIVDLTDCSKDMADLQSDMQSISEELNIKIHMQHEDLFRQMHRI